MSIDNQRRVDIHIGGTNCSGKTMMAVAMMNALARLGIENIKFINPEHTPDQIKALEDMAPQVIAEKLTDVQVTFHENFSPIVALSKHRSDAIYQVFEKMTDFLQSPHNDDSVTRQSLIAEIRRAQGLS